MAERGYHYCPNCHQIRWECYIKDGKCTFCNSTVTFIENTSPLNIKEASLHELAKEIISRDRVEMFTDREDYASMCRCDGLHIIIKKVAN